MDAHDSAPAEDEIIPPTQPQPPARRAVAMPQVSDSVALIQVIERAAMNPAANVDNMERLLAMQERVLDRQAKLSFIAAYRAMRPHLPTITRRGRIVVRDKETRQVKQSTGYARYDDIQDVVDPILTRFGFVITCEAGISERGKQEVTGILAHEDGHEKRATFELPPDMTGSKNALQAIGSSMSYAQRYARVLLLDLKVRGMDDDGNLGRGEPERQPGPVRAASEPQPQRNEPEAEPGPRSISPQGKSFRAWAEEFIKALDGSQSEDDLDDWEEFNKATLDVFEQKAAPLYQQIGMVMTELRNKFTRASTETARSEAEPGEGEQGGAQQSEEIRTPSSAADSNPSSSSPAPRQRRPGPQRGGAQTSAAPLWAIQLKADLVGQIAGLLTIAECITWSSEHAVDMERATAASADLGREVQKALDDRMAAIGKPN